MVQRVSRGRIILVTICLLTAVFGYFFWRDLRLPDTFVPRDLPDLVVENFSFKRTITDREWSVAAVSAEHKSGVVTAASVDLFVDETSDDRSAKIFAESGEFTRDNAEVLLFYIGGSMATGGSSVEVAAPVASYDSDLGVWRFPEGMEIFTEDKHMTGNAASIDRAGNFNLWKGVSATWVME